MALGARAGITLVPPHLAEEVALFPEDVRQREVIGKQRLTEWRYTTGQIDVPRCVNEIEADYERWCEEDGSRTPSLGELTERSFTAQQGGHQPVAPPLLCRISTSVDATGR